MDLTLPIIFAAGILSIFAPCIFPLIPSYFAYISGIEVTNFKNHRNKILIHSILFVLGFSIVFIIMGAAIGSLGKVLISHRRTIEIIGGIIIILFALQIAGAFSILNVNKHFQLPKSLKQATPLKSLLTGIIFAFGWSPCYGPILGSILTLTLAESSFSKGILYFSVYALGMGVTFIVLALLASKLTLIIKKTGKTRMIFKFILALIVLLLGIGMITGGLSNLANLTNNLYTEFNINKIF
ncbi:hypothetical protein HOE67_01325 [Candidatus Peregrinibacteria bacterium]|jgi:cytochrome c-type biogenesis protein|nr:hypothetical protein [Candidatus Peregrinibacteria bacterium]MBT4055728.1 hypothetical protein [Candidatus Peregrinibacteria bacterium]